MATFFFSVPLRISSTLVFEPSAQAQAYVGLRGRSPVAGPGQAAPGDTRLTRCRWSLHPSRFQKEEEESVGQPV